MISSIFFAIGMFITIMISLYILTGIAFIVLPILNIVVILTLIGIVIFATFAYLYIRLEYIQRKKGLVYSL